MKKIAEKKGFTLMEIMLYMMIATGILFAIISFSMQIMKISQKSTNIQEIQTNMDYIVNKLSSVIKSANGINALNSTFGADDGSIGLNVSNLGKSPTVFYMEDSQIYLKEGSGDELKLNSDFTKCEKFKFEKITTPKFPDQIMIDLECEPINNDMDNSIQKLSIHTTVSLRR